jgi:molybdenum cofactor biosynthesis protein B
VPGIDTSRPFRPLSIAVLTVSDTRTIETDTSGAMLVEKLTAAGHTLAERRIVTDDYHLLLAGLSELLARPNIEVILTTGGTGLTGRDVTPEAFEALCEKDIPGFGELFRMLSYPQIGTSTIQSRATAGVARGKLLFAVPGSTSACRDAWDWILASQLDSRNRPCNFAELLERLRER